MTDILIRGMKMPTECCQCLMCVMVDVPEQRAFGCELLKQMISDASKRLDDCPLVELPPHGDLISKPALFDEVFKVWGVEYAESDCNMLMDLINDAPVIVPSNKEDTP